MTTIRQPSKVCTVVVTVDAAPDVLAELESHAIYGLERFADFEGFVSGALHRSADGSRLIQYLQWETEADHLVCVNDPQWQEVASTRRFMEIVETGRATIDVRTYEILAVNGR